MQLKMLYTSSQPAAANARTVDMSLSKYCSWNSVLLHLNPW
jgi:hypothetical protein